MRGGIAGGGPRFGTSTGALVNGGLLEMELDEVTFGRAGIVGGFGTDAALSAVATSAWEVLECFR